MYRVYGDMLSGNCYKIKLLLEFLAIRHEWQHMDILAGETQSAGFLAKNANGKIPLLQISDQEFLAESNAILNYLADGTDWLPEGKLARARVLQWQFFEQYSHEPYIAVARYINRYLGLPSEKMEEFQSKQAGGHKALRIMESQLQKTDFIAGNQPTIADISLYGYTHVAHEGGFELADYAAVGNWLARIENIPGYVPMTPGQV